jgi:hypothetical protein
MLGSLCLLLGGAGPVQRGGASADLIIEPGGKDIGNYFQMQILLATGPEVVPRAMT